MVYSPTSTTVANISVEPISLVERGTRSMEGKRGVGDSLDSEGFQRGRRVRGYRLVFQIGAENWSNTFIEAYCYFIGIVTVQHCHTMHVLKHTISWVRIQPTDDDVDWDGRQRRRHYWYDLPLFAHNFHLDNPRLRQFCRRLRWLDRVYLHWGKSLLSWNLFRVLPLRNWGWMNRATTFWLCGRDRQTGSVSILSRIEGKIPDIRRMAFVVCLFTKFDENRLLDTGTVPWRRDIVMTGSRFKVGSRLYTPKMEKARRQKIIALSLGRCWIPCLTCLSLFILYYWLLWRVTCKLIWLSLPPWPSFLSLFSNTSEIVVLSVSL